MPRPSARPAPALAPAARAARRPGARHRRGGGFALDDKHGINVIGAVPTGLPGFALPDPAAYAGPVLPAVGVLLVGYSDVVLTARAFARHDDPQSLAANRELPALGVADIGAGVLHGFPISSSAGRTALADSAGARTQAYSLVGAGCVTAVLRFLGPLLAHTPSAALGAIVVYASVRLIEVGEFRRLAAFRRREFRPDLGCGLGVLALGILYGVLLAVALSVSELLTRVARPPRRGRGNRPGPGRHARRRRLPERAHHSRPPHLPLRLAAVLRQRRGLRRRALASVSAQDEPVDWFVLNTEANVEVDITALDGVGALRCELTRRDITSAGERSGRGPVAVRPLRLGVVTGRAVAG